MFRYELNVSAEESGNESTIYEVSSPIQISSKRLMTAGLVLSGIIDEELDSLWLIATCCISIKRLQ